MPRTADHTQRRSVLSQAVGRLAIREGLDAVTISKVARETGFSVGLVQHYYASKQDLLIDAHTQVRTRIEKRIDRAVQRAERRHERIEHILGAALMQLLPLDRSRREEGELYLAFAAAALHDPPLMVGLRATETHVLQRLRDAVGNGKICGEVPSETDSVRTAQELAALTTGLMTQRLLTGIPHRTETEAIVRAALARSFPGACRRGLTRAPM